MLAMETSLLELIDAALEEVRPMIALSFHMNQSSASNSCSSGAAGLRLGLMKTKPGPVSMGLIAVREFDRNGDRPEPLRAHRRVAALHRNQAESNLRATLAGHLWSFRRKADA